MAKTLAKRVFPSLALGLAKYVQSIQKYPYPPQLLYAQHHLSLALLTSYPATITDFLGLCKKPLEEWWPGDFPEHVEKRFPLLDCDGELEEQVFEYLIESNIVEESTLREIQDIIDRKIMGGICEKLRYIAMMDPIGAQREYIAIRSFVISHPWTRERQLQRELSSALRHLSLADVGELYKDTDAQGSELLYQGSGQAKACYWNCLACGPLYQRSGRLGSIQSGVCEKRCPGPQTWQPLTPEDYTRVLKRGVQLSTHIPGLTEMELYHWLQDEVRPKWSALQQVELWPGVDTYDLRLTLRGKVWAVDVKDYKSPFWLGEHIKQDKRSPEQNDPLWHEWFYVYPTYREQQRLDYGECARRAAEAESLPANVKILSAEQFTWHVLASL